MLLVLFLIFIVVPIAEVAAFIEAGRLIGVLPTILITIGTAIAGSLLMRIQGLATVNRLMLSLEKGEMPVTPVADGMGIMAAGLLLLTPGLITDTIGFLLFIPPLRRGLTKWLFRKALQRGTVNIRTFRRGDAGAPGPGSRPRGRPTFVKSDDIVDAEFETIDPGEDKGATGPDDGDDDKKTGGKPKRGSPWRKP
jgi:UPF0716 protein FxsA